MTTRTGPRSVLIPGLSGLAVFGLLQIFFSLTWANLVAAATITQPWWLNSGRSVVVTLVVVSLATVAVLTMRGIALLSGSLVLS